MSEAFPSNRWIKTAWYCPGCGKQTIMRQRGEGDFYDGPMYLCADEACGGGMCHPHASTARLREPDAS